ncbi:M64 family metallopeptidase [Thalassobellus suaedae]|uniref:M64 family metallopeptidase n=1 Tax=Thalassobellus suaedae TaxID=3074124 RepID=A0ABY9XQL7_9FLAO|nr:M64 family metallopeptidase [Flavobacteriaceae bacterium HL-DH14]
MKYLLSIVFLISFQSISAQVFEVVPIETFDDDKRINLVILSEGYQESELDKFIIDATDFTNDLFSQSPFSEYSNYFNVYAIKIPSNESGADHPGTSIYPQESSITPQVPIKTVDTYFNATFDAWGYHRYLYYGIDYADSASAEAKINSVLASNFPTYDQALILVNSTEYGGTGGEFPIASRGSINGINANEISIHELGHSLFNLKDEYVSLNTVYFNEAINMTQESDPSLIKWKNWLNTNGVGLYPYHNTLDGNTWYRPHKFCKMNNLSYPFCPVCKEGIIEKIHELVSPIDTFTPTSNTLDNSTFPINFHLELIEPNPNTLKRNWTLNTLDFATDVDDVSVLETDLNSGVNTLTVVINDETSLIRVDNHDTFHVYTVTWTIDNTLGFEDINSKINNYNISMFPNPSNNIVNFKLESSSDAIMKVDIISLDGKIIKTISISNYQTHQVDISNLSQGIYLTNFYTNNTFIASKKLVKK